MAITGYLTTKDYQHFQIGSTHFEGATNAHLCLPGDEVEWQNGICSLKERADHSILVGTLELASKTTYGLTARNNPIYLFIPYNRSYPPFYVGCSEKDRSYHQIATIKFDSWTKGAQFPRGTLQKLLGKSGDLAAEEEALLISAHPWPSLRGKNTPVEPTIDDATRRPVEGFTFNVDPVGCKDIDDVISLHRVEVNKWRVTITIADVAAHIREMGAVDILASTFGQTLYRNGEALCPMIPPSYSEDACSLLCGQERKGLSLTFLWSPDDPATASGSEWFESRFTNNASYTYEEFEASSTEYRTALQQIATGLDKSHEPLIDSHKWIEVMMKFYNVSAGKMLKEAGVGILRRHSAPVAERLAKYAAWNPALSKLAQGAAEYCLASDTDSRHYGLAEDAYCHATSPIRRYADLMNQRILKQIIRGNFENLIVTLEVDDLNRRAKAVKQYEKNLLFLHNLITGPREVSGKILDIDGSKIRVWIECWQKTVKLSMRFDSSKNLFISADEKDTFSLKEGDDVNLICAMNLLGRHWKDRLVIRVTSLCSL